MLAVAAILGDAATRMQVSPACNTAHRNAKARKISTALSARFVYVSRRPHGFRLRIRFGPERKEEWMKSIQLNIRSYALAAPCFALMRLASKANPFQG